MNKQIASGLCLLNLSALYLACALWPRIGALHIALGFGAFMCAKLRTIE